MQIQLRYKNANMTSWLQAKVLVLNKLPKQVLFPGRCPFSSENKSFRGDKAELGSLVAEILPPSAPCPASREPWALCVTAPWGDPPWLGTGTGTSTGTGGLGSCPCSSGGHAGGGERHGHRHEGASRAWLPPASPAPCQPSLHPWAQHPLCFFPHIEPKSCVPKLKLMLLSLLSKFLKVLATGVMVSEDLKNDREEIVFQRKSSFW